VKAMAGSQFVIAGYASLFGTPDLAGDVVEQGAFADTLKAWPAPLIRMLFQHDPGRPIGRWTSAYEDGQGLWMQGVIEQGHLDARAVLRLIQNGKADGLSIGFRALDAAPRHGGGRILKTIDLREVSVVTFPMLPRARLRVRAEQSFSTPTTHQAAA
jgi:uncharacterized protein